MCDWQELLAPGWGNRTAWGIAKLHLLSIKCLVFQKSGYSNQRVVAVETLEVGYAAKEIAFKGAILVIGVKFYKQVLLGIDKTMKLRGITSKGNQSMQTTEKLVDC